MAATMVAMMAKSKNSVLAMEKKQGWSIQLPELRFPWDSHEDRGFSLSLQGSGPGYGGLFASVGLKVSTGAPAVAPSPGEKDIKIPFADHCIKYVSEAVGYQVISTEAEPVEEEVVDGKAKKKAKKHGLKLKIKIGNPHLRRLVSGAVAGAVSRTCVAPLETIRTHLMVGSNGDSMTEVFQSIMNTEGWTGLFRGNLVNVIRVAPSKAIEVNYYLLFVSLLPFQFPGDHLFVSLLPFQCPGEPCF
jgi:solute carrier family 25 (mitochondrial phosphate transporter), member 23/24/25/41